MENLPPSLSFRVWEIYCVFLIKCNHFSRNNKPNNHNIKSPNCSNWIFKKVGDRGLYVFDSCQEYETVMINGKRCRGGWLDE